MRTPRLILSLLVIAAVLPAAAQAAPMQEDAKAPSPGGDVAAQLTYDKQSDFQYRDVRIKVTRGGATLLDILVPAPCDDCPVIPQGGGDPEIPSLTVRDLNADGEPEVLVDLYTGGAHCCSYTQIWSYHEPTNAYRRVKGSWGDYFYELEDLNGDGRPEFNSRDFRFAAAFTAYAASGTPPRIFTFQGGKLVNVTKNKAFRGVIKKNLRDYLALYKEVRKDPDLPDVRGFLAAYVADKYLLGQGDTAFDLVNAAYRRGELKPIEGDTSPSGKKYISNLRKFLRKTGYR